MPGVAVVVADAFPESKPYLDRHWEEIISTPFQHVQEMASFSFFEARQMKEKHPNYTTFPRLLQSQGTLVDVRAFLYHELGLRELFSGDG